MTRERASNWISKRPVNHTVAWGRNPRKGGGRWWKKRERERGSMSRCLQTGIGRDGDPGGSSIPDRYPHTRVIISALIWKAMRDNVTLHSLLRAERNETESTDMHRFWREERAETGNRTDVIRLPAQHFTAGPNLHLCNITSRRPIWTFSVVARTSLSLGFVWSSCKQV